MNYKKGFIAPLILIIIALLVLGGGAYVYVQKNQANQSVTAASTAQTTNSQTYTDSKWGFTLQFPPSWSGEYTVTHETSGDSSLTDLVSFNISKNGGSFAIGVYTKSQWSERLKLDYPAPSVIAENNSYVFTSYSGQNGAIQSPLVKDISSILATFKLRP
jgi:archaellum component FlaF (FlaF/FlaG flagellin family)